MTTSAPITIGDSDLLVVIKASPNDDVALQSIVRYRLDLTLALAQEVLTLRDQLVKTQGRLSKTWQALQEHEQAIKTIREAAKP